MNTDKKAIRIQVSAEEARKNRAAQIEYEHKQKLNQLEIEGKKLDNKQKKRRGRSEEKQKRRDERKETWQGLVKRIHALMPTVGRRAMIAGPILAPMAVAWVGQISFAKHTLGWMMPFPLIFAAAWELTTAFSGWMYHQARESGDRGILFRFATWLFATAAGAMNYWHACPVISERLNVQTVRHHIDLDPNPKAVSYGAMSLVGIALWELYSSLIHRQHLRAEGKVPDSRPQFGVVLWLRYPRITWRAWSLCIRYGIKTVDNAWSLAAKQFDYDRRQKAAEKERKRLAKDNRTPINMTVVHHTYAEPKTSLRLYRVQSLGTTLDHLDATTPRQVDATTPVPAIAPPASSGRDHPDVRPDTSTRDRDHQMDATTPASTSVSTPQDHQRDRTRTQQKTTKTTGRVQVDASGKTQPTEEDKEKAIAMYLQSVRDGKPLSKRALAKRMGFSPSWALKCIQEAGPRPVGDRNRDRVQVDATTPKDQPVTSEVKTG